MKQYDKIKLYLDTSVPSAFYDTSKPVRQLVTQKWFEYKARTYALYTSATAVDEIGELNNTEKRQNIRADANPYDPEWCDYLTEREKKKHERNVRSKRSRMWIKQHGICPICQLPLSSDEEEWDIHHIIPKSEGGSDDTTNLTLLHLTCHGQIHLEKGLLADASRRLISA